MGDDHVGLDAFAGHLLPGESVEWWGQPQQGLLLTRHDGMLIPFSLLWGGFSIFWEVKALQSEQPLPFGLFGIPFVFIGLYLIAGRFAVDAWLRARMFYALTDRRVLIVRRAPWPNFQALSLGRLPETTLNEGSHGRGTIRFGTPALVPDGEGGRQYASSWTAALDPTPQFLAIDDARNVFAAIQQRARGV